RHDLPLVEQPWTLAFEYQLRVYVNETPQIDIGVQEGEAGGPLHRSRRLTRSSCALDNHCAGRCQPGGKGLVEDPRPVGIAHKALCDNRVTHFVDKSQCIVWPTRYAFCGSSRLLGGRVNPQERQSDEPGLQLDGMESSISPAAAFNQPGCKTCRLFHDSPVRDLA